MEYKIFDDAPDFVKKDNSTILSRNISGLQEYKTRKNERIKLNNALDEINNLKKEIEQIKSIIGIK